MQLDIIAPGKTLFSGQAKAVQLPGKDGRFGILENHAPLISALQQGEVKVTDNQGKDEQLAISGGVVEVLKNKVIVLAEE